MDVRRETKLGIDPKSDKELQLEQQASHIEDRNSIPEVK
jgi:hypothetical protein